MSGDWLAFVVGWARDIIGTLVILGGLALAVRVLWLAWRTGNAQVSQRFAPPEPRPASLVGDQGADGVAAPDAAPAAVSGRARVEPGHREPEPGRGLYGGA